MQCVIPSCDQEATYWVVLVINGFPAEDAHPLCRAHTDRCAEIIQEIAWEGDLRARIRRINIPR